QNAGAGRRLGRGVPRPADRRGCDRAFEVPEPGLNAMDAFRTLAGRATGELEERGSRFLAVAVPVADRAGAEAFFAAEGRTHRNPTHVVPAFRLRDGVSFSSDAGEPAGSAGAPVLAVLAGADLHDVAAVVVRWYGGTNLGVGGLVRAYGGALARALDDAVVVRRERAADV